MKFIDKYLDKITMYRLVLYVLVAYVGLAVIFSFTGQLSPSPTELVLSLALLMVPALIVDKFCGYVFRAPTNSESWLITSLIMFLIIQPANSVPTALALMLAGALSSASKFLLSWNNKHIFNPAALGAAVVSLTALQSTTWWIGSSAFLPFTLVLGLLVIRKIRRFPLFLTFISVTLVVQIGLLIHQNQALAAGMKGALIASPLIFMATIMLTEPATMPPRRREQMIFAALAATLYVTGWQVGPFVIYPEVALLLANVYAFAVSPKFRVRMHLTEVQQISDRVYNYVFKPEQAFTFIPGQYMEWTLSGVPYDSRGNRRTLTIASSPTEDTVQLGIKYADRSSAYKSTLSQMQLGDEIYASQLAGNFTLDAASTDKLVFIAGGIGITPIRSMIKYLVDTNQHRDIILLYVVPVASELAYAKDFIEARQYGVTIKPIVTREATNMPGVINAKFTKDLLLKCVPDYDERTFYISGPSAMVDGSKRYLHQLDVPHARIKTDHFTGY